MDEIFDCCRSAYRLGEGVVDLFSSQPLQRQFPTRQHDDHHREGTETQGHTDKDYHIDFLPITGTASGSTSASVAQPILIPTTPVHRRNPDRVPTPLSGRGDRKGHLFPVKGSSPTRLSHYSAFGSEDIPQSLPPTRFDPTSHHRSLCLNLSPRSRSYARMHGDRAGSRYTPTSPLSPRLEGAARPMSPQPSRPSRQASRPMNIPIPKYHPLQFQQQREMPAANISSSHNPILNYTKHSSTTESPRLMKERQRELLEKAKMSSRIAASPYVAKPDAPRLDPLGSPKGPVTPLALEEGNDYFLAAGIAESSPSVSPSPRGQASLRDAGDGARVKTTSKQDDSRR